MDEKQITDEMINKKLEQLYFVGIEEPKYASVETVDGSNPITAFVEYHYDENSALRKKVVMTCAGYISKVELYDEKEHVRYIAKRLFKNDEEPTLNILKYYISGEGQNISTDVKEENYKISELNFNS